MEKLKPAQDRLQLVEPFSQSDNSHNIPSATPLDTESQISPAEKNALYALTRRRTEEKESAETVRIRKAQLINKINFINFQDRTLLVNLKHRSYNSRLTLVARPQPCIGDELDCSWEKSENDLRILDSYEFQNILIPDGQNLISMEPDLIRMDKRVIRLLLPEHGVEVSSRKMRRHASKGITVQLIQNSTIFSGKLVNFNACSFKIELTTTPPQTFEWINSESSVNLILSDHKETYYSGECKIIRHDTDKTTRVYILKPLIYEIQRFKHKEFRSHRYHLRPSPNIFFKHPFTDKRFDLKVVDLSGSGFAVEENQNDSVLLPGMILPELELSFANSFHIKCRAQVVYRQNVETEKEGNRVRCGVALLDIDIQDHVKLIGMLQHAKNENAYFCNRVSLDELWNFFFETGFIYPDKYGHIEKNKHQIKATYEKLYNSDSSITRHFIYQENGRIMGHMAMLRYYKKTWLIHHHAARKAALNKAGLIVLDQIGRMGNNAHRLDSLHMDYLICYYRPDNKFPSRVFGGAAKAIHDPKGCSSDAFAYYHHQCNLNRKTPLPDSWQLNDVSKMDLLELENFYQHISGGLMLDATDLRYNLLNIDGLSEEYKRMGLHRQRLVLALRQENQLKAVITVNLTDLGLNLSDLTNCVKIMVLDAKALTANILNAAMDTLAVKCHKASMPVLLYPAAYADEQDIAYEKHYHLWALSLQFSEQYFRYINRLLRFF
jgi:hypothetical protein